MEAIYEKLLWLSHELGKEERGLAILGEGNTSVQLDAETFAVKASGCTLATLSKDTIAVCEFESLLDLLDNEDMSDHDVDQALMDARIDSSMKKPSVEAMFHASLLSLPEISFVGHTHPITVNQLLCGGWAQSFADQRLFPDQIVCCGDRSLVIPYTDPGFVLAKEVHVRVRAFIDEFGQPPVTIVIENHGLIALGKTEKQVLSATLMAEKSAKIFTGALQCGKKGPVFLSREQVQRIAGRPDEHYRQKMLS
ncbi:MAG: class II aldolase/adducin family protein [Verrucomicrobiota bacterium]